MRRPAHGQRPGPWRRVAGLLCAGLLAGGAGLVAWAATHQVVAPQPRLVSAASAQHEKPYAERLTHSNVAAEPARRPARSGRNLPDGAASAPAPTPSASPREGHRSHRTPHPRELGWSRPLRVVIPSVGIDSRLQELGTNPDGTLEVPAPPHYDEAGWFTGSPAPGQDGPAVLLGHIDGVGTTPSVFFELGAVEPGDHVTVTRADGRRVTFTVYRVERYAKDSFPTRVVYGDTPGPELRLITCGGTLDPETGHYRDNTVVYARMAAP